MADILQDFPIAPMRMVITDVIDEPFPALMKRLVLAGELWHASAKGEPPTVTFISEQSSW